MSATLLPTFSATIYPSLSDKLSVIFLEPRDQEIGKCYIVQGTSCNWIWSSEILKGSVGLPLIFAMAEAGWVVPAAADAAAAATAVDAAVAAAALADANLCEIIFYTYKSYKSWWLKKNRSIFTGRFARIHTKSAQPTRNTPRLKKPWQSSTKSLFIYYNWNASIYEHCMLQNMITLRRTRNNEMCDKWNVISNDPLFL